MSDQSQQSPLLDDELKNILRNASQPKTSNYDSMQVEGLNAIGVATGTPAKMGPNMDLKDFFAGDSGEDAQPQEPLQSRKPRLQDKHEPAEDSDDTVDEASEKRRKTVIGVIAAVIIIGIIAIIVAVRSSGNTSGSAATGNTLVTAQGSTATSFGAVIYNQKLVTDGVTYADVMTLTKYARLENGSLNLYFSGKLTSFSRTVEFTVTAASYNKYTTGSKMQVYYNVAEVGGVIYLVNMRLNK